VERENGGGHQDRHDHHQDRHVAQVATDVVVLGPRGLGQRAEPTTRQAGTLKERASPGC
jgi:hypothetical protein